MRVGIIGTVRIAGTMAETIAAMKNNGEAVELSAVASRDETKAKDFVNRLCPDARPVAGYEELLKDDRVDLVYIATPHSHHARHMKMCIEHGKAVLCEKSFTSNAKEAEEVLALAEQKKVPVTEAIWTRYQPVRKMIDDQVASGVIGDVKYLTVDLSYTIAHKERIRRPELAGGALLDLGVYPINFASMVFGTDVLSVDGVAMLGETGVDLQETISIRYRNGAMACLSASALTTSEQRACICGSDGDIVVEHMNNPTRIHVHKGREEKPAATYQVPPQLTGYEYEVRACMRMLETGALECPEMPHEETIRVMRMMDHLRAQWHVVYPWEK